MRPAHFASGVIIMTSGWAFHFDVQFSIWMALLALWLLKMNEGAD